MKKTIRNSYETFEYTRLHFQAFDIGLKVN